MQSTPPTARRRRRRHHLQISGASPSYHFGSLQRALFYFFSTSVFSRRTSFARMIYFRCRPPPPTVAPQGEGSKAATQGENKGAEGVRVDVYTRHHRMCGFGANVIYRHCYTLYDLRKSQRKAAVVVQKTVVLSRAVCVTQVLGRPASQVMQPRMTGNKFLTVSAILP